MKQTVYVLVWGPNGKSPVNGACFTSKVKAYECAARNNRNLSRLQKWTGAKWVVKTLILYE